jgi:hypothetical protein
MRSPAPTSFKATALPPAKQRKVAAWTHGSKPRIRTVSPSQRHPSGYVEKHLILDGYDCTALWHQAARNEIAKYTRHLTPAQQRVAKAFASDCTVGGHYYWSQERLARRSYLSREKTNRALKRLSGNLNLLHIPAKQRRYHNPKTLTLRPWLLTRILSAVHRALHRIFEGHTRKAQPSVAGRGEQVVLPSLAQIRPRFQRKRRYSGGWMVRCPCHDDRTPSLSLSEGDNGKLLWFGHAGCSQQEVREALTRVVPARTLGLAGIPVDRWQRYQAELHEFTQRTALEAAA